jgi:hypothetical protein
MAISKNNNNLKKDTKRLLTVSAYTPIGTA